MRRYDLFGWDYPLVAPLTEAEVAWHRTWAERTGGPVLGLACGTGRLLCELARAGFDVVGIDLSETMLRLAQGFAAKLPDGARRRVRLVKADMSDFDLAERFGLACIADNSFRELSTRGQLLACLGCIRRHLRPGGALLITERRFDASLYPGGQRSIGWSQPRRHPETGDPVSRRIEVALSADGRHLRGKMTYRTAHADGGQTVEQCPFESLVLTVAEYVGLFAEAGFQTRVCVGYQEKDDDGSDPLLCFVCRQGR